MPICHFYFHNGIFQVYKYSCINHYSKRTIILAVSPKCDPETSEQLPITWKQPNSKIQLYGTTTVEVLVTQNNGVTGMSLASDPYIGYLLYKKQKCGADFMNAFEDGRLQFDIMDYTEQYDTDEQNFFIYLNKAKSSLTLQYRYMKVISIFKYLNSTIYS